jgi:glucose-6-phosphate 1-epimerase
MNTPSTTPITAGAGGMPKICLSAVDSAQAEIYLYGAHITSWVPAGGEERLFLSQRSEFRPGAAIRGGVPVIFPQFGGLGTLPKHGFARTLPWDLTSLGGDPETSTAEFHLEDSETTRLLWPHLFQAKMKVSVGGTRLKLDFSVTNSGSSSFSFTAALHTYLRVENIFNTIIDGLHGLHFHDTVNQTTPADWVKMEQTTPHVNFPGEVDRVYYNVPGPLKVIEPGRITTISTVGFTDAVIWNPGPLRATRLADLEPDGYTRMVCVEAAIVGASVTLDPGKAWYGTQLLSVD